MSYDAEKAARQVVAEIDLCDPESALAVADALRAAYEAGRSERPSAHPALREWLVRELADLRTFVTTRDTLTEVLRRLDAEPGLHETVLHETTRALLAAMKASRRSWRAADAAVIDAWEAAGCPDAGETP